MQVNRKKIYIFSFYKQISISKINLSFILVPDSGAMFVLRVLHAKSCRLLY